MKKNVKEMHEKAVSMLWQLHGMIEDLTEQMEDLEDAAAKRGRKMNPQEQKRHDELFAEGNELHVALDKIESFIVTLEDL